MKEIIKTGVVAEYKGGFWGIQYEDGQCCCEDFGPIEKAKIGGEFCTNSTDFTWTPRKREPNPKYEQLKKAVLKKIRVTTNYEILDFDEPKATFHSE